MAAVHGGDSVGCAVKLLGNRELDMPGRVGIGIHAEELTRYGFTVSPVFWATRSLGYCREKSGTCPRGRT